MQGNTDFAETRQAVVPVLSARLPAGWAVDLVEETTGEGDGTLRVSGVDTSTFTAVVHDGHRVVERARLVAKLAPFPVAVVSEYLTPQERADLDAAHIAYADSTGWISLAHPVTGLFLRDHGAARRPGATHDRPRGSAITRMSGVTAGRLIQHLLDAAPSPGTPLGVRELAGAAAASPGTSAKVLKTLDDEGIIERSARGAVTSVRKRALLDRWARDYSIDRSNARVVHLLDPRGLDHLVPGLRDSGLACFTGTLAASAYLGDATVPNVPTTHVVAYLADDMPYARDPESETRRQLRLTEVTPAQANCTLVTPKDPLLFDTSPIVRGLRVVPVGRTLVDLMTTPGRDGLLADQLIAELATHDDAWRS